MNSGFDQRGRVLEDEFFHRLDKKLMDKLKKTAADEESRKALASETGIEDESLLQALVDIGVTPESVTALSLVPLVFVAWADQNVDAKEALAIRDAAGEIEKESVAGHLLDDWLTNKPSKSLFEAWQKFVKEVLAAVDSEQCESLKKLTLERCEKVAKASGGLIGFGAISPSEQKRIEQIKETLDSI